MAQALPLTPGGKIFMVANSSAAGYNDIVQKYGHNISGWYSTTDAAHNACIASRGDVILIAPNHNETLADATSLVLDTAGVTILGLGSGANRPTFSFSATTSNIPLSAASVVLKNVILKATINNVTAGLTISGASCDVDVETQDTSASVEFISPIVTTAAADKAKIKWKHIGFLTGSACLRGIDVVGMNSGDIDVDFFGGASTAVVNLRTTASDNVRVTGKFHNGTTALTKNVVDSVGTSTWSVSGFDVVQGASFSGSYNAAVAADDVSVISTSLATLQAEISGAAGLVTWPSPAYPANGVSIAEAIRYIADAQSGTVGLASFPAGAAAANDVSTAEVLRYAQENIINGAGTALPSGDSLYGVLAGATGITTFPAAAAPANSVSIAEVLREMYDQADKSVVKAAATIVSGTTQFTVAGGPIEILSLVSVCVTGNDATASTLQWSCDGTDGAATTFTGASASLANAAAGASVVVQGTGLTTAPIVNASGAGLGQTVTNGIVIPAGIITTTVAVGSTTGTWSHHLRYRPLARGVTVS